MFASISRIAVVFGALFLTLSIAFTYATSKTTHPPKMPCESCHLAGDQVTQNTAHQIIATQKSLCSQCHQNILEISHPSGFAPVRPLPVEYPLDWKGDLTCSSCHAVHHDGPGKIRGGLIGRDHCLSCHDEEFFTAMADSGLSIQQTGHLSVNTEPLPGSLDVYSMYCLGCHFGDGHAASVETGTRGILRYDDKFVTHPVGGLYADALARGIVYPAALLPDAILLPDGRVSCVSCHVGYAEVHGQLVISNKGSALCLTCHKK